MAQQFDTIKPVHQTFIEAQHLFFVGSAAKDGRVNVSPKGMDSLRVLGPNRVAWLNLTGSGNETAAHLLDTNRITIMFCSFTEKPLILRLYGQAQAIYPRDAAWSEMAALFPEHLGRRQIYDVTVDLVQTSCGFAVPFYEYVSERDTLTTWTEKRGDDGVVRYWEEKNQVSIDGFKTGILEGE